MSIDTLLARTVPVFASVQIVPQLYTMLLKQSAENVSFESFLLVNVCAMLWIVHALSAPHGMDVPLLVSAMFNFVFSLLVLVLINRYGS